jgi:hypothetical protein
MDVLELNEVKFHKIDNDNEIEIEIDGWFKWITVEETEKLIEFLNIQLEHKKETFKSE